MAENDYGVLAPIVATAGTLIAAASAIIVLAWRGRRQWEPELEGAGILMKRIAALVVAILLAWLYVETRPAEPIPWLPTIMQYAVGALIGGFVLYVGLYLTLLYEKDTSNAAGQARTRVVGGFCLTQQARDGQPSTIQEVFAGMNYQVDHVWPRSCRVPALLIVILTDIVMVASGAVALTIGAILLERTLKPITELQRSVLVHGRSNSMGLIVFPPGTRLPGIVVLEAKASWTTNILGPKGRFGIEWGQVAANGKFVNAQSRDFPLSPMPGGKSPIEVNETILIGLDSRNGTSNDAVLVGIKITSCETVPSHPNDQAQCTLAGRIIFKPARP